MTPSQYADVRTFRDALYGLAGGSAVAGAIGGAPGGDVAAAAAADSRDAAVAVVVRGPGPLGPVGAAMKEVLSFFADALGQASASYTSGTGVTREHGLTVTAGSASTLSTGEHLGPGPGDRIVYLWNARLAWITVNGNVTLALLGFDAQARDSVAYLRRALAGQLPARDMARLPSRRVIEHLLALDPLASQGPRARLTHVATYLGSGLGETGDEEEFFHEVDEADSQSRASYQTSIEDYRRGWLSFLGIGVQEDVTLRADFEATRLTGTTTTVADHYKVTFHAPTGQRYAYEVLYDRVFGTYAVVESPVVTGAAWLSGAVTATDGRVLPGELVELVGDGRRYLTRTDAQGRYAFFARDLTSGRWRLKAGEVDQAVEITRSRPTVFNLRMRPRLPLPTVIERDR